jgi:hypothetical protein
MAIKKIHEFLIDFSNILGVGSFGIVYKGWDDDKK